MPSGREPSHYFMIFQQVFFYKLFLPSAVWFALLSLSKTRICSSPWEQSFEYVEYFGTMFRAVVVFERAPSISWFTWATCCSGMNVRSPETSEMSPGPDLMTSDYWDWRNIRSQCGRKRKWMERKRRRQKKKKEREKESRRKSGISLGQEEDTWKRWKDRKTKNWLTTKKTQQEASKTEATLKDNQTSNEIGPACQS